MTVTITEMENGFYSIPLSTAHSDTTGLLTVVFTNGGSKQVNLQWRVEAAILDDIKSDTAAILIDTGTTLQAELDAIQAAVITNAAGVDIAADIIAVKAETASILTDTADIQPKIGAPAADLAADIAAVKVDTAATLNDTGTTGVVIAAAQTVATVTTLTGHTPQTGDSFARLAAPAGVSVSADIAAIKSDTAAVLVDTADMQPKLGAPAGADMSTDIAAIKTDTAAVLVDTGTTLDTKINDIQGATFSSATDSLEAIRDRGDAAWTTGAGGSDRLLMVDTTIATLASQTSFTLTAGSADDNAYVNCTAVIEDVSTATQKAVALVSAYTGATKTVTLKYDPAIFTMAATDKIYILAENALKSTAQNRQLDVTTTGAAGIDWGNVENPTTAVDLSATDIQLVDTTTTNTDMRGTDSAALASVATEARLSELDAGTGGKMANQVDIIEVDTTSLNDTKIPDTLSLANINAQVDSALDTAIPGVPTANSINERIAAIDDLTQAAGGGDLAAILTDTADMQPKIGSPAGASVSADIAAVKVDTAATLVDTTEIGVAGAGLTNINLPNQTMDIVGNITGNLSGSVGSVTGAVGSLVGHTVQTGDNYPRLGAPAGASVSADVAAVKVDTAATLVDTAVIGAAGAGLTDLGGMSAGMKAEVKVEAVAALNTDTYAEPGQEAPGATVTLEKKISYLYKFLRNRITSTATTISVYDDAATTVDHKSTHSDDGTVYDRNEFTTGP